MNSFRNFLKATAAATIILSLGACAQGPTVAPERVQAVLSKADPEFLKAEIDLYVPMTDDEIAAKFAQPTLSQLLARAMNSKQVEQSLYGIGSGHAAVGQTVATGAMQATINGAIGAKDNSGQTDTKYYEQLGPQWSFQVFDGGSKDARIDRDRAKTAQTFFEHNGNVQDIGLVAFENAKDVERHRERVAKVSKIADEARKLTTKVLSKVKAGYSPESELFKARGEIKDVETKLELAKKELAFSSISWRSKAGFDLPEGVVDDTTSLKMADGFRVELVRRNHPRIKALQAVGQATINETKAVEAEVFGNFGISYSPLLIAMSGAANPISLVTTAVQYQNKSLMDGGDRNSRLLKMIYQFQAIAAGLEHLYSKVDEAVEQALSAREHDMRAAKLAREAADLQQRAYKAKLAEYDIIGGSVSDLITALQATMAAELAAIDAETRAELADARVAAAQGEFIERLGIMRSVKMSVTSDADLNIDQFVPGKAKSVEQASQAQ